MARTDDVKDVIRNLQNLPTSAFLRSLSLHEWILLVTLLRCVRRAGVSETPWADVSLQHTLCSGVFADSPPVRRELEGVLDALLIARVVLSEAVAHGMLSLVWSGSKSSTYLEGSADSNGEIFSPRSRHITWTMFVSK